MTKVFKRIFAINSAALALLFSACSMQESVKDKYAPTTARISENMQTIVLGAGCFWCVEAFFEHLDGVEDAISGYAGGKEPSPTYQQISRGLTTHAEVVKIVYDPDLISYRKLIDFFWTTHDATRSDGVWPDFGPQYRSILLYQNDKEKAAIEESLKAYESQTGKKIATEIKHLDRFYPAETYHQDYAKNNPSDRYVRGVLNPKLKKLDLR